jgi:hypothetical protein
MKLPRCTLLSFALCALLSAPPLAAGQAAAAPPLSESLTGSAKLEYDAARLLYDDGDFKGALVKFERAFQYSGDVRLLWNMAVCEKSQRHYVRVLRLLQRYRELAGAGMSEAQRAEVLEAMQTVQTLVSRVELKVDQAGAEVFVDDVSEGTTPLTEPLLVDLGRRQIRIAKPHFKPKLIAHDFAGNSAASFDVHLQPELENGKLTILADPDSQIRIDGNLMGQAQWRGELPAGEHTLQVSAPGKETYHRELVVHLGEERSLRIGLEQESSSIGTTAVWIGAGALLVGGITVVTYFLLRPASPPEATSGTLPPFKIVLN